MPPTEPLDYATAGNLPPRPPSAIVKWILIVLALVILAFVVLVGFLNYYAQSIPAH